MNTWGIEEDKYSLEKLLDIKALFWGENSIEYKEWKDYFLSLSETELQREYEEHFPMSIDCSECEAKPGDEDSFSNLGGI